MRAGALETYLQEVWYGARPGHWLRPLGALYGGAMRLREALYDRGILPSARVGAPVVVVGNLTVGGTGKTPLVLHLVETLRAAGRTPGVVSRGYGGEGASRRVLFVEPGSDPAVVGDEPVLIARRSGAVVAVCPDRVRAARAALDAGANILIADDGLQHRRLARDAQIVVIDGARRFGNGRCLPAGPLRSPPGDLARFDLVIVNGDAAPGEAGMTLEPGPAWRLDGQERRALEAFRGRRVHAVAAIGHPQRFFATLRAHGLDVVPHPHRDHSVLRASDLTFDDDLPVFITEKDAVKCPGRADAEIWVVPVDARLDEAAATALARLVARM